MAPSIECIDIFDVDDPLHFVMTDEERIDCSHENVIDISGGAKTTLASLIMRPSSLGGGRILRRTLSVCLSVRPVIVAIGNVFSSTASVTDVLPR